MTNYNYILNRADMEDETQSSSESEAVGYDVRDSFRLFRYLSECGVPATT